MVQGDGVRGRTFAARGGARRSGAAAAALPRVFIVEGTCDGVRETAKKWDAVAQAA